MTDKNDYVKESLKLKNEKVDKEIFAEFLRNNKYGLPVDYRHRRLLNENK